MRALVNIMNMEHNPDLMLLATRTLTHMIEALPGTSAVAVSLQAVPSLCAKLLTIEYIDLAEQSLTALEKLSQDYGYGGWHAPGRLIAIFISLCMFA